MARGGSPKHSLATDDLDMPAIEKVKRSKKPKTANPSSTSTDSVKSTSSGDVRGHLHDREVSRIERWNDEIPIKATPAITVYDDQDAAVQAYLRAKAALLEKVSAKKAKTPSRPAMCACTYMLKDTK
ncbi:hypothetical protein LTR12_000057 [Friedmanniomyces endolithicus]|nr:hypothetical protein LTR74_013728 [Friedmanniomyces endolithicus]KAK1825257.1 hypothetical protein LTR12_000057 [Friedmanniomyces endolithicus]